MAAVRGIGVAVITSRCGVVPSSGFGVEAFALFHTNRCCSSITTKGQVRGLEGLGKRRVRSTIMPGSPLAAAASAYAGRQASYHRSAGWTGISAVTLEEETVEAPDAPIAPSTSAAASVSLAPGCARGQPRHHLADGLVMLFGKHLSGSHQHRLIAGADRLQHGRERHYGFAGADFALQQTLHGPVRSRSDAMSSTT